MKLTPIEAQSAVWVKVREHIQGRIDAHRRRNDGDMDPIQTARLRGRIAEDLILLEMENPEPALVADHDPE